VIALWLLACGQSEPQSVAGSPIPVVPDLVLVVVDTLRADHLGLYGHSRATSPRIDAWAAGGVVFDDAQAHSGWTLPSMASLFTGLLPHEHRAMRHPVDQDLFARLGPEHLTLAEVYRSSGHRTAGFGNNTFLAPMFGLQQGFDHYEQRAADFGQHRSAEETVDAALAWLTAESHEAFLMVHLMEPHLDYDPPASTAGAFTEGIEPPLQVPFGDHDKVNPYIEGTETPSPAAQDYIQRVYDEEILAVDQAFGRILDGVAARGRPAWIVLTADHGEEFWDHGGFEHGQHLLRELVRVPLVVGGPGVTPRRVVEPVSHSDLFVTLVDQSGAAPAHPSQGLDLSEVLRGSAQVPTGRVILGENCLYGSDCLAAYRDGVRFQLRPQVGNAALYRRGPDGQAEVVWEDPGARAREGQALFDALVQRRGSVAPIELGDDLVRVSEETIEQLRSLGYVE